MVEASKRKVLITGITGFLGSNVTKLFLQHGGFDVKGTVRSKTNMKKLQPLIDEFGQEAFDSIELVEADLNNEQSIIDACQGCELIIHTASPFPIGKPKKPEDLINPAVNGTLSALKGAQQHGAKRVVVTSSFAAIMNTKKDQKPEIYNEDVWSDPETGGAYERSKTMAEKAAWDFVEKLPEDKKFELVVINPVFILGPSFIKTDFSSGNLISQLLTGKLPGIPKIAFPTVDVRDVAKAHLEGAIRPEAANKRFILAHENVWFKTLAEIMKEEYGAAFGTKTHDMKKWLLSIAACFDSQAKQTKEYWGTFLKHDNSRSREILGIDYISTKEQVLGMTESLIKYGIVKDKRKK